MLDINKLVQAETLAPCEADAFLLGLDPWDETQAEAAARRQGLTLTDERMDALCWLRDHYAQCGPAESGRQLLAAMEAAFSHEGGRRYLFSLFPRGPIAQGCELAGLPMPPGTRDPSFGSTH